MNGLKSLSDDADPTSRLIDRMTFHNNNNNNNHGPLEALDHCLTSLPQSLLAVLFVVARFLDASKVLASESTFILDWPNFPELLALARISPMPRSCPHREPWIALLSFPFQRPLPMALYKTGR